MAQTATRYRQTSAYRQVSSYRQIATLTIAAGLTPPHAANDAGRNDTSQQTLGHGKPPSQAGHATASAGVTDISVKVRLIATFVLLACSAMATALIVGMELDGVQDALPAELTAAQRTTVMDAIGTARLVAYATAGTTALIAIGLGIFIALSIATPIQRITRAMADLASGKTEVDIPQKKSADEIGVMADTIADFKEKTLEIQRLIQEREEEQRRQSEERQRLREKLGADLDATVTTMVSGAQTEVDSLRRLAEDMVEAQGLANQRTNEVDGASERANEIADSFSGSVDDLSGAISDIEQRVEQTSEMSERAAEDARQADTDINALVQAADSITQIIDLINDIAGKTNMLALNATVEAVRAGDAGRSFQVVAQEIKNLSRQTADATKQVEGHIADIRGKTNNTAERVRGIINVIGQINTAAAEIQSAVEQQSQTASQISGDAREASEKTKVMRDGIRAVATQTENTETAAQKVRDSAARVGNSVDQIRADVDTFLERAVKGNENEASG